MYALAAMTRDGHMVCVLPDLYHMMDTRCVCYGLLCMCQPAKVAVSTTYKCIVTRDLWVGTAVLYVVKVASWLHAKMVASLHRCRVLVTEGWARTDVVHTCMVRGYAWGYPHAFGRQKCQVGFKERYN
jgi:hypothetical protein